MKPKNNPNPVSFKDAKYKIPNPEDIVPLKMYSFTINPQKQYPNEMLGYLHNDSDITKLLKHSNIRYEIHRELSSKSRVHYHGYIQFIDKKHLLETYISFIPKLMKHSTFYIDTIDDVDNGVTWAAYCTKQKSIWDLNNIPSILTNFNDESRDEAIML